MKLIAMNTTIAGAALDAAWNDVMLADATCGNTLASAPGPFRHFTGSWGTC